MDAGWRRQYSSSNTAACKQWRKPVTSLPPTSSNGMLATNNDLGPHGVL